MPNYFAKWLHNFTSPTALYQDSNFSTDLLYLLLSVFFTRVVQEAMKCYLIMVLIYFSWWLIMLIIFLCTYWQLCVFFEEMPIQIFCPFSKEIVSFIELWELFMYSRFLTIWATRKAPYQMWFPNIFPHSITCLLNFLTNSILNKGKTKTKTAQINLTCL